MADPKNDEFMSFLWKSIKDFLISLLSRKNAS